MKTTVETRSRSGFGALLQSKPMRALCALALAFAVVPALAGSAQAAEVTGVTLDTESITFEGAITCQLEATVSPSDAADKSLSWSSSDTSVAVVDANGFLTSVGRGTATITVTTSDGGFTDTCEVCVNNPVANLTASVSSLNLAKGESATFTVTKTGAFSGPTGFGSDPESTFCHGHGFDPANAELAGTGANSFIVKDASGKAIFSAQRIGNAEDDTVTWNVVALGTGSGKILLRADGYLDENWEEIEVPVVITVTNPVTSIVLDQASKTMVVGDVFTLAATAAPADADDATVTWTSSNPDVASVDAAGKVTAKASGTATITATAGGKTASCEVTIEPKQIAATSTANSDFAASVEVSTPEAAKVVEELLETVDEDATVELVVEDPVVLTEQEADAIEELKDDGETVVAVVLDAYFEVDGEKVSFNTNGDAEITVRIKMTDEMKALDPSTVRVVFVDDNGSTTEMETWIEGEYLCFKTTHFSTYAVTGKANDLPKNDGGNAGSGQVVKEPIAKTGDGSGMTVALLGFGALVAAGAAAVARRRMERAK